MDFMSILVILLGVMEPVDGVRFKESLFLYKVFLYFARKFSTKYSFYQKVLYWVSFESWKHFGITTWNDLLHNVFSKSKSRNMFTSELVVTVSSSWFSKGGGAGQARPLHPPHTTDSPSRTPDLGTGLS